jgi:asparagine synthase (glutamine-hydrolysing)
VLERVTPVDSTLDDIDPLAVVGHVAGPYAPRPPRTFFRGVVAGAMSDGPWAAFTPAATAGLMTVSRARSATDMHHAAGMLHDLLIEVVESHIGGQTVGLTLSAGMDSQSLAVAAAACGSDVMTLTWVSSGSRNSTESEWARRTARQLDLPLHEIQVDAETLLPVSGIETSKKTPLVNIFDGAWQETARVLRAHDRSVLLSGFGGDHLFGGHVFPAGDMLLSLRFIRLLRYLRSIGQYYRGTSATIRRELLGPLARQLVPATWARRQHPVPWLHPGQHAAWRRIQLDAIGPGLLPGRAERVARLTDGLILQITEEMSRTLAPHGVTLLHPLLDGRLVEFALRLPSWMLFDGGLDKLVLRHAMKGRLPDEVLQLGKITPGDIAARAIRAKAHALVPLSRRMRAAELGFVDEAVFAEHVDAFIRGDHDDMNFWNTLTLEDWLRRWW